MPAQFNRIAALLLLGALVAACGSAPSGGGGRYSISQDRAPTRRIDPDSIAEVVPGPVVRTSAGNRSPYTVLGRSYTVLPTERGYSARGIASWYGEKFHGHKTSNGEIFDMYKVSAAHTSLPIPSFLRVTNLENNRSIVVRVNDRGPFHGDRIIDLSWAAALKLGFADRGTARVQLDAIVPRESGGGAIARGSAATVLPQPGHTAVGTMMRELAREHGGAAAGELYLQAGAFADLAAAENLTRRLRTVTSRPVFVQSVTLDRRGVLHRVRIGPIAGSEEARQLSVLLVAADLASPYTVLD